MQVRSIAPTDGPNPEFKRHLPPDRKTNWPLRDFPIGTVLTGPEVYKLCLVQLPKHEPHDDEAKAIVASLLRTRPEAPVSIQLPDASAAASSEPTIPADQKQSGVNPRPPRANK